MPVTQMTHEQRRIRRAAIAKAVQDGSSIYDAACKFGVSCKMVVVACYENKVPVNGRRRPRNAIPSTCTIIKALLGKASMAKIATRHQVSRQRVQQIYQSCMKAGIPVMERNRQTRYSAG